MTLAGNGSFVRSRSTGVALIIPGVGGVADQIAIVTPKKLSVCGTPYAAGPTLLITWRRRIIENIRYTSVFIDNSLLGLLGFQVRSRWEVSCQHVPD